MEKKKQRKKGKEKKRKMKTKERHAKYVDSHWRHSFWKNLYASLEQGQQRGSPTICGSLEVSVREGRRSLYTPALQVLGVGRRAHSFTLESTWESRRIVEKTPKLQKQEALKYSITLYGRGHCHVSTRTAAAADIPSLTIFWRSIFSWFTFLLSSSLVCRFLLVAQFIIKKKKKSTAKSVFLWYLCQKDVHLFDKFRKTFKWTKNIENSSYHNRTFLVIVRNELMAVVCGDREEVTCTMRSKLVTARMKMRVDCRNVKTLLQAVKTTG